MATDNECRGQPRQRTNELKCPVVNKSSTLTMQGLEMMRESADRRVPRSRSLLQHALSSLILKKDYEVITVQDICEAANVGRSTFYAHFRSKDDLKRSGFESLRDLLKHGQREALSSRVETRDQALSFSLGVFEHAREHKPMYRALVGNRGGSVSLARIREILAELVRDELLATRGSNATDGIPLEFAVEYIVGAFMAILTWWLDGGARMPPDVVDQLFRRLVVNGIHPK